MKRLTLITLLGFLFSLNSATVVANIDIEAALLNYQQKIKRLNRENKNLIEQIQQLQQRQQISEDKIKSLFSLIKYKKSNATLTEQIKKSSTQNKQAKKIYNNARRLLSSAQYSQAIKAFLQYLTKHPKAKNAADAQYWIAKAYLAQKDYANAAQNFVLFQKQSPTHFKFPNSLLDLAKSYVKLNKKDQADELLNTLINKFSVHQTLPQAKSLLLTLHPPVKKTTKKPAKKLVKKPVKITTDPSTKNQSKTALKKK